MNRHHPHALRSLLKKGRLDINSAQSRTLKALNKGPKGRNSGILCFSSQRTEAKHIRQHLLTRIPDCKTSMRPRPIKKVSNGLRKSSLVATAM